MEFIANYAETEQMDAAYEYVLFQTVLKRGEKVFQLKKSTVDTPAMETPMETPMEMP